jgi:hypothetical protein
MPLAAKNDWVGRAGRRARIGIAALLLAVLGACGGDDDDATPDAGQTPEADAAPVDTADAGADDEADAGPGSPLDARGGFAPPRRASSGPAPALPPGSAFNALQLNLCNSGQAGCYADGQSIPEGVSVVTSRRPDLVTLNEVCEIDVEGELFAAMTEAWPDDYVFWVFAPAARRSSGGPVTCNNGQRYGVGLIGHVAAASWTGFEFEGERYEPQDPGQDEMRAWACALATGNYYACVTHLTNADHDVGFDQCSQLMSTIVPQYWGAHGGELPTIVGGDFNLTFGGSPDVQDCVPTGWYRKGDGDVQHVIATDSFAFDSTEETSLEFTDHPAWLVRYFAP